MADGLACDLHWTWGRRMDRVWFRDWASNIDELTAAQRREATAVLSGPPEGEASLAAIELGINEERRCPHSDSGGATAKAETAKARARVEHQFRIIKRVFGCDRVRHRGLERNVQRLAPLPGFSNLMIAQPHLS